MLIDVGVTPGPSWPLDGAITGLPPARPPELLPPVAAPPPPALLPPVASPPAAGEPPGAGAPEGAAVLLGPPADEDAARPPLLPAPPVAVWPGGSVAVVPQALTSASAAVPSNAIRRTPLMGRCYGDRPRRGPV